MPQVGVYSLRDLLQLVKLQFNDSAQVGGKSLETSLHGLESSGNVVVLVGTMRCWRWCDKWLWNALRHGGEDFSSSARKSTI